MPTSADHPLVLTLEDGIVSSAKFGTVAGNIFKLNMTREQIPDKWEAGEAVVAEIRNSNFPPTAKKTILARAKGFQVLRTTNQTAEGFKTRFIDGINKAESHTKIRAALTSGKIEADGQTADQFIRLVSGSLAQSARQYLDRVATWGKVNGGPGAPLDFDAESKRLVRTATYNGTIHWTGHGNAEDLLSYPATEHRYYRLPVLRFASLLLQPEAVVKPTLVILNSCNTGISFINTLKNNLETFGDLGEGIRINAPTSTASGAEVTENLKKWRDGELQLPWPSVVIAKN